MEALGRGPRGGNIENPATKPEWRRNAFNGNDTGLHRAEGWEDTTTVGIKNEQPWHRMAAYMLNAGRTNSEIAMAADVTSEHVSHLRAQRWFQELCATIANTEGEEILGLIRSETAASIEKIVSLRDFSDNERVQLSAAITLLEHSHGKPIQKVVSDIHHSGHSSPEEEMSRIQEELAALRRSQQSQEIPEAASPSP